MRASAARRLAQIRASRRIEQAAEPPTYSLTPYQWRWIRDGSPSKVFVKSRRIGGSWIVGFESACRSSGFEPHPDGTFTYDPAAGVPQRIISASHNQAKELLERIALQLETIGRRVGDDIVAKVTREQIDLRNGRSLYALAANPRTIRGGEGDVTLDELGAMPRAREVWKAARSVTNKTLGFPEGFRLRAVGTPMGDGNLFYEIAKTDRFAYFSRHFVDIHAAVREGFPEDPAKCREEAGSDEAFAEEYECAFLGAATRYISQELFERCTYEDAERPQQYGYGFAGMDVGRSPTGDPSALQRLTRIAGKLWDDGCEVRRGETWDAQEAWVADVLTGAQRIAIDGTGLGNQFCERLVSRFGSRVQPVEFTSASKEMLATGLRLGMDRGLVRLRADHIELKRAVLGLRREITTSGNTKFDTERDKHGHGDRAWALALGVHAAGPAESGQAVVTTDERSRRRTAGLRSAY